MSSYPRQQLEKWVGEIEVPAGVRVLDVGGAQKPVKGRTKSWGDLSDDWILDLPEPHEGNFFGPNKIVMDIQEDGGVIPGNLIGHFDIAFCLEVSEYWFNPLQALKNIALLLGRGGTLYISFHFFYPTHPPRGADYLRYTRWGAEKLLKEAGFEIEELVPRVLMNSELVSVFEGERMHWNRSGINPSETGCMIKAKKL